MSSRPSRRFVKPYHPPSKPRPGIEGCGESVSCGDRLYFYRTPHALPRDGRVVIVRWEGGYNHGVHAQDHHYLAIACVRGRFLVLDDSEKQRSLQPLCRLSWQEAGALVAQRNAERKAAAASVVL